ncbi:MAG: hypothetical protein J5I90_22470 [Caldilineales bacterium]|nr:hypothetical protein [Caldilineales bacterium]
MADILLTQAEADALLALKKYRIDDTMWPYPGPGEKIIVPLESADKKESFLLDVSRGSINLAKGTYQNRARKVIVLARLDFNGPPHRNPDGIDIPCPHLHIYREGYGDKWAIVLPEGKFTDETDPWAMLQDFMNYCNIEEKPDIQKSLLV